MTVCHPPPPCEPNFLFVPFWLPSQTKSWCESRGKTTIGAGQSRRTQRLTDWLELGMYVFHLLTWVALQTVHTRFSRDPWMQQRLHNCLNSSRTLRTLLSRGLCGRRRSLCHETICFRIQQLRKADKKRTPHSVFSSALTELVSYHIQISSCCPCWYLRLIQPRHEPNQIIDLLWGRTHQSLMRQ